MEVTIAGTSLKIANVYVPPASSCPANFVASIAPLLAIDAIVLGDINGHNEEWSMGAGDPRGDRIGAEIDNFSFVVLNDPDVATRPSSNSSPNVAFAPSALALNFNWITTTTLNSDHVPVSLCFADDTSPPRGGRTYTNFKKANWEDFTRESEALFSSIPPPSTCAVGEKEWRRIMQRCSARHIPAGYHRVYVPGLDPTSASLIAERDERRRRNPLDPELVSLNLRISASIASTSRLKWMETVSQADRRTNPAHFWRLLKSLSGKKTSTAPNQPIIFNGKSMTKKTSIANNFCKHYANIRKYEQNKDSRRIIKNLKINNPLDANYAPFSPADVVDAIKESKNSTAAGPNGLTILHLKHLGPNGLRLLTHLFNLSVQRADIPALWKTAHVIPILKPEKPADQPGSYRPISLLCPEIKVLERLLLPSLNAALSPSPSQHGFRGQRSCVTALLPLATKIAHGFNAPKPATRTGLLCVDLSKAFDVVAHHQLLDKVAGSPLHRNLKRWLSAYLRDRKIRCLFQGAKSKWKKIKMGVPQGSVISPVLFNFFVNDISSSAESNGSYADDFHAAAHAVNPTAIADSRWRRRSWTPNPRPTVCRCQH